MRGFPGVIWGTVLCLAAAATAAADAKSCPVTDEQFVEQLSTMKDWSTIYSVFKRNLPACPDDGFYAEGYTEAVVVALANRWSDLGELEKLLGPDANFRRFVYQHINASADEKDLQRVLSNARTKCPPGSARLCGEIAARAKTAIAQTK
jgi:hypothetical protein